MKKVAIFTPIYKHFLEEHEKISLDFLKKNLNKYDKFFVVPESFDEKKIPLDLSKFKLKRFPDKFFTSIKGYNNLLYIKSFYEQFKEYEYLLSYQPDCLVFKDELEYFCSLDYDYIGAPFIMNNLKEIKNVRKIKHRNGGFSLRKVDSFIKIAEKYEKKKFKNSWFWRYYLRNFLDYNIGLIKGIIAKKRNRNNIFTVNEDIFWSFGAKTINHNFKIAPFDIAISFSFENNVPLSFKMNNNKLPFGAHAFQCKKNLIEWKKLGVFEKNHFDLTQKI